MKKGFTLVELLAVIILLGLLGLIIYPTVNGVINTNKQKLHNKQVEELKRYADTYATYNMSNLKTYDGYKNIVTFSDLYSAGIIQSDKVVDPANDEEMTGCMTLTWSYQREAFESEYIENCQKSFTLSGTLTGTDSANSLVRLVAGNEVLYETTADGSGNYSFADVWPSKYILIASQPFRTKYGREVEVYEDTTYNMTVEYIKGDIDGNNVIDSFDSDFVCNCIVEHFNGAMSAECLDASNGITKDFYDLDKNNAVNLSDRYEIITWASEHKTSDIVLNGTASLKGKFDQDFNIPLTLTLRNNQNTYTRTITGSGSYSFDNIPRGLYYLDFYEKGYLEHGKYIYLDKDMTGVNIKAYAGDVDFDDAITSADVVDIKDVIANGYSPSTSRYAHYDLNKDGVIDNADLAIVQRNVGKRAVYE